MSEWISVEDRLPEVNQCILVYRPQALTDDHTDKPIRCAIFDGNRFDCWHQPVSWKPIEKPRDWNGDLEERQNR